MVDEFTDIFCTANQAESMRVAELLRSAGIAVRERVTYEIGHAEFVVDVQTDKKDDAIRIFWASIEGPTRSATSGQ